MSIKDIKATRSEKGFTIVELLIVIVIIGILAAIVILAYNGVQNRARLSSAQSAASNAAKKAEAYNTDSTAYKYPTTYGSFAGAGSSYSYAMPTGSFLGAVPTAAPADPTKAIWLYTCGSGAGVRIGYWDYAAGAAVTTTSTFTAGDVTGTCTLATT